MTAIAVSRVAPKGYDSADSGKLQSENARNMSWLIQTQALLQVFQEFDANYSQWRVINIATEIFSTLASVVVSQPSYYDHRIYMIRAAHLYIGSGTNNFFAYLIDKNPHNLELAVDMFTNGFEGPLWDKVKEKGTKKGMNLAQVSGDVNKAYKSAAQSYKLIHTIMRIPLTTCGDGLFPESICSLIASYDVRLIGDRFTRLGANELLFRGRTINETVTTVTQQCGSSNIAVSDQSILSERIQGIYEVFYLKSLEVYGRTEFGCPLRFMHGRILCTDAGYSYVETAPTAKWDDLARCISHSVPIYSEEDLKALVDVQTWPPKLKGNALSISNMIRKLSLDIFFTSEDQEYWQFKNRGNYNSDCP